MGLSAQAIEEIGEPRIEIDLDQDRHGEQRDDAWLGKDLLALKAEEQHQRGQQRCERQRLQRAASFAESVMRRRNWATMTGSTI